MNMQTFVKDYFKKRPKSCDIQKQEVTPVLYILLLCLESFHLMYKQDGFSPHVMTYSWFNQLGLNIVSILVKPHRP